MDNSALEEQIKELRQFKRMAEELKGQITAAEDKIKAELALRGVDEVITDQYKVIWKPVFTTRLDVRALRDEQPELYLRYAKQVESRRFVVS